MQVIKSLRTGFGLVRYASFTGTVKAIKAYAMVKHSDSWMHSAELLPPYPPDTPEIDGRVKTVRFVMSYHGKKVHITGWRFWETFLAIKEVFIEKEYDWLEVAGKKVLDLGAFTGDSAISFAMRGASEIYTCEPNPNMINIIHYNIKENGLQNKVRVLHCFVGGNISKATKFYFDSQNMVNRSSAQKLHEINSDVPTVTLDALVKKYGISNGCLKMDIEGAEYEVISATPTSTLRKFTQMQVDFHNIKGKSYKSIKNKLEKAGFDCEIHFVGTCKGGYISARNTRA